MSIIASIYEENNLFQDGRTTTDPNATHLYILCLRVHIFIYLFFVNCLRKEASNTADETRGNKLNH